MGFFGFCDIKIIHKNWNKEMLIEVNEGIYVNPNHVTRITYRERKNDGKYNVGICVLGDNANIELIKDSLDETLELIDVLGRHSN